LAISVLVDELYRYNAVVDTGSPFLTASADILPLTFAEGKYAPTEEQYGETKTTITWRRALQVLVGGVQRVKPCRLGVIPEELRQDTGGLFCGLIWKDDARPSLLRQMGRSSFTVDYVQRSLTLHRKESLTLDSANTGTFNMYDLTPFGPDLYHYAIEVDSMKIQTKWGESFSLKCQRPIVAVVDTGLTGCIFSDSFIQDDCLPVPVSSIEGASLTLQGGDADTHLSSHPKYWNLACFRLPWFTNEDIHPHIVAVGATFLRQSKITVDARQRRIKLDNLQP
jgi:hypothetical protein